MQEFSFRWANLPSRDWTDGSDVRDSFDNEFLRFAIHPDSGCALCSVLTGNKTAEMIYMSQEWDYYYCYRCRRWFKKRFDDQRIFLEIKDKAAVKHLTWVYVSHLETVYEQRRLLDRVESIWRVVEGRFPRK